LDDLSLNAVAFPAMASTAHGRPRISASASLARVKFTMSEGEPSGRLIRYMPGQAGSGAMRESSRLSVTLLDFCPSDDSTGPVTLRTASAVAPGRAPVTRTVAPRSRARCVAFRQRELQKRAGERCGSNCDPQAVQVVLKTAPHPRLGLRLAFGGLHTIARRLVSPATTVFSADGR